jgi:hypothetical protein
LFVVQICGTILAVMLIFLVWWYKRGQLRYTELLLPLKTHKDGGDVECDHFDNPINAVGDNDDNDRECPLTGLASEEHDGITGHHEDENELHEFDEIESGSFSSITVTHMNEIHVNPNTGFDEIECNPGSIGLTPLGLRPSDQDPDCVILDDKTFEVEDIDESAVEVTPDASHEAVKLNGSVSHAAIATCGRALLLPTTPFDISHRDARVRRPSVAVAHGSHVVTRSRWGGADGPRPSQTVSSSRLPVISDTDGR